MLDPINDWELLRYFLAVGQAGSLSGAAEVLAASHPTVARKIDQLEDKVGAKLLARTSTGAYMTEAGTRVLRIAEEIQGLVRSIPSQSLASELSGTIHFKGSDGMGGYWLPYMLQEFCRAYPNITLRIECTDLRSMPDMSKREADIAVVYREPTDPDVTVIMRGEVDMSLCASIKYIERHGIPKTWDELLDHQVITHDVFFRREAPWEKFSEVLGNHKKIAIRTNSYLALEYPLTSGMGITMMPISIGDREPLVRLFTIDGWSPKTPYWLVCHREIKDLPTMRALIQHLRDPIKRWASGRSQLISA